MTIANWSRRTTLGWGLLALGLFFSFEAGSDLVKGRKDGSGWGNAGVAVVIFAVGSLLLWSGTRKSHRDREIAVHGRLGEATVTGVREGSFQVSDTDQPVWVIRYAYRDHLGQEQQGESTVPQTQAYGWKVGDKGKVRFEKSNPNENTWLGERAGAPQRADEPLPSLLMLVKRAPSLWVSPLLIVFGYLQLLTTGEKGDWQTLARPYLFLVLGLLLLLIGIRKVRLWWRALKNGVTTEGVVTAARQTLIGAWGSSGRGIRDWAWVVRYRYQDDEGHPHEGKSGHLPQSEGFVLKLGDQCQLRFDPQHPADSVWIGKQ